MAQLAVHSLKAFAVCITWLCLFLEDVELPCLSWNFLFCVFFMRGWRHLVDLLMILVLYHDYFMSLSYTSFIHVLGWFTNSHSILNYYCFFTSKKEQLFSICLCFLYKHHSYNLFRWCTKSHSILNYYYLFTSKKKCSVFV